MSLTVKVEPRPVTLKPAMASRQSEPKLLETTHPAGLLLGGRIPSLWSYHKDGKTKCPKLL